MVHSQSQDGELEQRFSHLLQPIRDLTKNWDVDIATQLEEYLEELETISITFDGGSKTMNFAEAALLIQGSACVYSKKVEYLYSLVYQVLDLLASKKKQQTASADGSGKDTDGDMVQGKDEDEDFLLLDDIKEPRVVDKKLDDDITINFVLTIPKIPLSLVPLEEGEKGDNPLYSKKGEVLGSRMDFRMNTAQVHSSGFLLLDMAHVKMLDQVLNRNTQQDDRTAGQMETNQEKENVQEADLPPIEDPQIDPLLSCDDDNDDHEDNEPPPVFDLPEAEMTVQEMEERVAMQLRTRQQNALLAPPQAPKRNVWTPLDPHEASKSADKPFRKKKCFRIPEKLQKETSKKRKHQQETSTKDTNLIPIAEFIAKVYHSNASKMPSNPLKVPAFPEFEDLYWTEFRRRQQLANKQRKEILANKPHLSELLEDDNDRDDHFEPAGNDDDDDCNDGIDFNVPEMLEGAGLQENEDPFSGGNNLMDNLDHASVPQSFEDLVRQHVEGYMASAQQYAQLTELAKRVAEWEDNILPRLAEEESHEPFDIHKYGSKIIDTVETNVTKEPEDSLPEVIPFSKVVERQPAFQVCRMFLATLQLANAYNVEIVRDGQLEQGVNTMKLKLLNRRRHFEELAEYRAPSIQH